jgi:hypothetical protein
VISTPNENANGNLYTASPYPSCITVPNSVTGTVSSAAGSVQVQLTNVDSNGTGNYLSLQETEILLQSPSGAQLELLGGPGDGSDTLSGLTMLIASGEGYAAMPNGNPSGFPSSGTKDYEPSSYEVGYGGTFPSPGPGNVQNFPQSIGSSTLTSVFSGVAAAGTWNLWMIDNYGDPVTVNGWKLILTVNASEVGTTTVVSSSLNPSFTSSPNNSVTFMATVTSGGNPVTAGGTVAFYANGSSNAITCGGGNQALNSSGEATCTTSLTSQGFTTIVAKYSGSGSFNGSTSLTLTQLVEAHQAAASGNTWCNSATISVPDDSGLPQIYPSIISVSGYSGNPTVGNVTVELEGATGPSGVPGQFLLVAPNGQNLDFLDFAFSEVQPASPVNLTILDTAGQVPSGTATTGNYEPYDDLSLSQPDTFPASTPTAHSIDSNIPAIPGTIHFPAPRDETDLWDFGKTIGGAPANGDWVLYAYSYAGSALSLNNGWCITLDINNGAGTTTALASSQQKTLLGQSVTLTATVTSGGNPVTSGTVTFEDGGLTPAGTVSGNNVVTLNGSGQAAFTTSSLTEGDHDITATYSGVSGTYDGSYQTLYQRVDNATTVSNVTSSGAQFCNTAGVTAPNRALGAFTPNPSNIFVSNMWGTINNFYITLYNWDVPDQALDLYSVESLLVGPQAALDFFSMYQGTAQASEGNYSFSDSGSALNTSNVEPGTYKPISDDSFADTFFQDPGNFYTLPGSFSYAATHGSATLTSVFGSSNPNGMWSLYFNQYLDNATTGAQNGWCLNFTENAATVTATTESTDSFVQGTQGATLTVNIKNTGTGSTGDPTAGSDPLTVTDTLNADFSFVNTTSSSWSCSASGQTVTCKNDSAIASGSSYPALTINVNVSNTATAGQVSNAFNVTGGAGVTATSSNADTVTIVPAPVLSVQKNHSGTFTQGSTATWDISVSNTESGSATSGTVNVSDALPLGYTVNSFGTTSSSWTCGGTTTVSCSATLSVSGGSSFPEIEVTVNVPSNSPTSVTNTALAWGGGDVNHTSSGTAATGSDTNVPVVQVPASISATAGSGQSAVVGQPFATALQVKVLDAASHPVPGVTVSFSAPTVGASASLSTPSTTNSSGLTSVTATANSIAGGPYSVTASVSGVSTPATLSLTNTLASIPPPTACVAAPANLTAWWKAEGNANDVTGAYNATLGGDTGFATGEVGQAFSFDGTQSPYVGIPSAVFPFPSQGPFSFETWFQTPSGGAGGVILGQQGVGGAYGSADGYVPALYVDTTGLLEVEVFWSGGGGQMTSSAAVNDGAFHHVAVTYDGTNEIAYLDGAQMGLAAITQTSYAASYSYQLGTGYTSGWLNTPGGWYTLTGLVDESTVYARALAASEVLGIYSAGTYGKCDPAVSFNSSTLSFGTVGIGQSSTMTAVLTNPGNSPLTFSSIAADAGDVNFTLLSGVTGDCAVGTPVAATQSCNIRVSFAPTAGGPLTGSITVNDNSLYEAGTQTVQLQGTGDTVAAVTATGGTPQSAAVSTAFSAPLQVKVTDGSSNPVNGVTVTFRAPSSGASATLSSSTAVTNSSGVASVTATANAIAGGYTVTASVNDVSTPASFSLTNTVLLDSDFVQIVLSGSTDHPPCAVGGTLTATDELENTSTSTVTNPYAVITELTQGNTLISQSASSSSVGPGDYVTFTFHIQLASCNTFDLFFNVYGN